jgi:hypothetical protein
MFGYFSVKKYVLIFKNSSGHPVGIQKTPVTDHAVQVEGHQDLSRLRVSIGLLRNVGIPGKHQRAVFLKKG